MASSDLSESPPSRDGAPERLEPRPHAGEGSLESILWERAPVSPDVDAHAEPDYFGDLNLDQVLEAMVAGREQYDLKPFFYAPLHDVAEVRYRHEVLRDLEKADVHDSIAGFGRAMQRMREHLEQVEKLHYGLQKQAWFLDAVGIYCEAVSSFADELTSLEIGSRGLQRLREYLSAYTVSERFTSVAAETRALKDAIAEIRYAVHIQGGKVTVGRYRGEADYSAEVEATFARFKHGAVRSHLADLPEFVDMNHVEAHILEFVARL